MNILDILTIGVAALGALECVAGRLAALHLREHRALPALGYLLGAGICILAASLTWQGIDARWLDVAAWVVAAYLMLTWADWRHGPPLELYRSPPARYQPAEVMQQSSQFDDGR